MLPLLPAPRRRRVWAGWPTPWGSPRAPIGRGGVGWREASQRGGRHLGWRLARVVTAAQCLGDPGGPESPGRHRERRPLRNLPPCLDSSSGEVKVRSRWHILELFYFSLEKAVCTREGDSHRGNSGCGWRGPVCFSVLVLFPWFIIYSSILLQRFYFGSRSDKSSRSQGK